MFEPRHVVRAALLSLLGSVMALSVTSGYGTAKAESLPSALTSLAAEGSLKAQNIDTSEAKAAPTDAQVDVDVPFSELNEALSAARARLAELTKAGEIAKVASELRQKLEAALSENWQLKATLNQARSDNAELQTAKDAISLQAREAEKTATAAATEARRLDEELVAMRWQNSQLSTSLARTETIAREATEELKTVKDDYAARIEALSGSTEASAQEVAGLRKELDATRESALIAEQRGAELDEELARKSVEVSEAKAQANKLAADFDKSVTELTSVRSELATTRETLDEVSINLTASNQEAAVLREQFAANREEADQLRQDLEAARVQVRQVSASNSDLQQQVKVLRTAAGEATDAARLNLIAVENQIDEINAALATVKSDELIPPSGGPTIPAGRQGSADIDDAGDDGRLPAEIAAAAEEAWVPELTPARAAAAGQQQLIAATSPTLTAPHRTRNPPAAGSPLANRVIKTNNDAVAPSNRPPKAVAALITGLPDDRRQRAATLLADLDVRSEPHGLTMTVPGTILFAVNSDKIEPDAYDMLAKVAEIVDLYSEREVLIVGHTDAVGDDRYNQALSERRADLVRNYFVEEFAIKGNRLSSEGQGEKLPITSNATAEGRDANRRVEVTILK